MSQSIQPLESRRLLAVTLSHTTWVLDVTGTPGNDVVSIVVTPNYNISVRVNNDPPVEYGAWFPHAIRVNTGAGNDRITIGTNTDATSVHGGDGNDTITGGGKNDTLYGDNGNDLIMGGGGNDTMDGGAGNDTLSGQGGFDTADYRSAASAIRLTLDKLANDGRVAIGEKDNVLDAEQLLGGIYNDSITGDAGFNQIYGGAGNDEIHAGAGNDDVHGGPGSDKLFGGDGNDTIKGDDGNDLLGGENGNDSLDGGLGADGIYGNDGNDTADYSARTANLSLTQDGVANDGQAGETDNLASDVETIKGGGGNDLIQAKLYDYFNHALFGNGGNDTLLGSSGIDTLDGGAGNDRMDSNSDEQEFYIENDDMPVDHSSFVADLMLGGAGDDTLIPGRGDDIMYGGAGNDTADYSSYGSYTGIDVTLDGKRNDGYRAWNRYFLGVGEIYYSEADNVEPDVENVIGTYNFDRLYGNDSANRLVGGPGNDTLFGGGGNDTLDGAGANVGQYNTDNDSLDGGAGDDLLLSRDAYQDTLDGGLGYDRAQVDSSDQRSDIELLLS